MFYRFILAGAAAAAILTNPAGAEERVHNYEMLTLENGLRVVTVEDFSVPTAAVQLWYEVGSKDEDPERQGFAHMFEHMMFRGTERVGPEEHFDLIRAVGGTTNAFTSFDYTAYVNTVPANQLDLALWLEADRMMFLNVTEEDFAVERRVVEEERRQYLNQPYGTVFEELIAAIFQEHPYRWHPIGNIGHLRAATVPELQEFWDYYYVPNNAVLVIVGAVSHEDAQERAREYFGWIPRGPEPARVETREPTQEEEREITIEERIAPVPQVGYVYQGVSRAHPDYTPLRVLMNILGYGQSSRLYEDLVRERGLANEVSTMAMALHQDGFLYATATLQPGQDMDEVLEALNGHMEAVREEPVDSRELEKIQNRLRYNVISGLFSRFNRAREMGAATLELGHPEGLNEELQAIAEVTPDDILRVAQEYLEPQRRTVLRVVPNPEADPHPDAVIIADEESAAEVAGEEETGAPGGVKAGVEAPAEFPETPPLADLEGELPPLDTTETVLENGLRVVVIEDNRLPHLTMKLGGEYGAWAENPETPGAASLAMAMLTRGTENYTAAELAETLEFNAISLSGSATRDDAKLNLSALAEKLDIAMELMAEAARRPVFPEEEFETLRRQRVSSLSVQESDPSQMAERELNARIFGDHPYARPATGRRADVEALTLDTVREWWRTFLRPDAAVLYVAGDIGPNEAFERAEAAFGDWKPSEEERPDVELPSIPEPEETHIYLVDQPGAVQSHIQLGQTSITRGHPDYHFSRVYSQVYGGGPGGRLFQVVRAERGLTYGAYGLVIPHRFAGKFFTATFTETANTVETVEAVLEVLDSMRENPPGEAELESAKAYLTGSFPGQIESPSDVVSYQWIIDSNGLPSDYLQQAMDGYRETAQDDIERVANDIIDPSRVSIVVVGDASVFKEALETIAPVTVVAEIEDAPPMPMPEGEAPVPAPEDPLETP